MGELVVWHGGWEALSGSGLADHLACPAFGDPELLLGPKDGRTASVRGQKLPLANSFSLSMSMAGLATSSFGREFSFYSPFSLLASPASPSRTGCPSDASGPSRN